MVKPLSWVKLSLMACVACDHDYCRKKEKALGLKGKTLLLANLFTIVIGG